MEDPRYDCPHGGDTTDECADCVYACDYYYDLETGECLRREEF